jgi:hypothetical protein
LVIEMRALQKSAGFRRGWNACVLLYFRDAAAC